MIALSFAVEDFQHPRFQRLDLWLRLEGHDLDGAVRLVNFPFGFLRSRCGEHDIGSAQPVADLAQDRFRDFPDLARAIEIGLVDHQQHRLVQIAELLERIYLDPVEIAVGDEQHKIGVADSFFSELAAQFAGGFVDAGSIDQHQLGVLEAALRNLVGRTVLCRHRKDFLAGKRIQQRALPRADFAECRDLKTAVLELRREFLDVVHFLLDRCALLRSQPVVCGKPPQRFDRIGQDGLVVHRT